MIEQYKKNVSYTAGFFMLIAFCIGGFILSEILSINIWSHLTGNDFTMLQKAIANPAYIRDMQLIQTVTTIVGFFIATLVTASFLNRKPFKLLGFKSRLNLWQLVLTILIIICGMAISGSLGYASYQLPLPKWLILIFNKWENTYAQQAAALLTLNNIPDLIGSIIVIALVPAICEETFFRGGLQNFIYRSSKNLGWAIIVASTIFSLVHMSGYGFLSRLTLGIMLGLIYHYSGNLWLNILAHFINNAISLVMIHWEVKSGKAITDIMNDKSGDYWGLLAIPVVIYLFYLLKTNKVAQKQVLNGL